MIKTASMIAVSLAGISGGRVLAEAAPESSAGPVVQYGALGLLGFVVVTFMVRTLPMFAAAQKEAGERIGQALDHNTAAVQEVKESLARIRCPGMEKKE